MHVGMSAFFQNFGDRSDADVYREVLALADRAEPLGFDSIWSAEHHFDGYTMCPNVAQFLTYMAGRTKTVKLGSMVAVLPWHHPVRMAEEFSVLDILSGGRAILGVGRGLGRIEFEGFDLDMNTSRERFVEHAEAVLQGLETGIIEKQGNQYKQSRVQIRPASGKSFRSRVYASAVSPESAEIMARLGIGILIIAQKPWDKTIAELDNYRQLYRKLNGGMEAPKPLIVSYTACHQDAAMAEEMRRKYIHGYCKSAVEHYEFANVNLASIKGYEYYGGLAKNIAKHGIDGFTDFLADLQIWGTPDAVFNKMIEYRDKVDAAGFINIFSFGGMPFELSRNSMELFARSVLPRLKAIDTGEDVGGPLLDAAE